MNKDHQIFYTESGKDIAESIAKTLETEAFPIYTQKFSDGELFVKFDHSIRGKIVIIISRVHMPYENLFELYLAVDAARRASAREIITILPYLPHSRQERKDRNRTSISSRLVADFLQKSGANRLMTIDMHTNSIEGFYTIPVDHLEMVNLFANHIHKNFNDNLCLCSPDFGGLKRVKNYKKLLNSNMAVIHKERLQPNRVANMEIIGDVKDANVCIIDDIVDTAGTLCKAAEVLMQAGARSVSAYCTHGLLSGNAVERINNSELGKLYITDTLGKQEKFEGGKIEVLPSSSIISKAIDVLLHNKSIKELNEEKLV